MRRFASVRFDSDIWCIGGELAGTSEVFHTETNKTQSIIIENFNPPKGKILVNFWFKNFIRKILT